jgi:hypothetical protein
MSLWSKSISFSSLFFPIQTELCSTWSTASSRVFTARQDERPTDPAPPRSLRRLRRHSPVFTGRSSRPSISSIPSGRGQASGRKQPWPRYLWLPVVHPSSSTEVRRRTPSSLSISLLNSPIMYFCSAAGSCYLSSLVRLCKPTPPIPLLVEFNCLLLAKATCDPRQFPNVYKLVGFGVRKRGGIIQYKIRREFDHR